jgi:hypothetical protein
MAIGQLPTVDYNIDVTTPFQAAVQGLQFAAGRETLEAARNQRELEAQARQTALAQQQQYQSGLNAFFAKPPAERKFDDLSQLMIGANKQQFDALKNLGDTMSTERKEASQKFVAQGLLALEAKPELFQTMAAERISVETDPNQKRALETVQQIAQTDPKRASMLLEELGAATFGKTWYEGITSARAERRTEAALPQDGFTILPEADRVRANLPEGVYQKGPKGEIKLLSAAKEQFKVLTPAEVKAVGLPPGTYQQGPTGEIKTVVKEPLVSVSVGQQGQRDTLALKELDIPRAQEFSGAAASARTLARDARVISNLLKGKGGGAVIKLGADIAKNFGFTTDTVVANDLANSLAIRGATQMRPPGSGSTSDIEFKAFVSAFPSLANSEGGRELMAKYADAFAKRTAKIADHARKLIRADNYSEEEIARFDESLGPILDADFYDLSKQGRRANVPVYTPRAAPVTPAAPAAAPAVSPAATAPRTVDSVLQQYLRRQ